MRTDVLRVYLDFVHHVKLSISGDPPVQERPVEVVAAEDASKVQGLKDQQGHAVLVYKSSRLSFFVEGSWVEARDKGLLDVRG